ncbi:uncharacterized protein PgNI_01839 [Pyricularia grisea]|uniref:Uncharacterized protein n=1 Tax=Pyricularia grisea TaxID=148305 RepID=A0A6P8BIW2_PYRGI|nr:uncharacterized protein PgNI_01839 [Pyricularia grisea]TLD16584.1 hypothetical protein PgNI_01839 [Pyricularia grisea]
MPSVLSRGHPILRQGHPSESSRTGLVNRGRGRGGGVPARLLPGTGAGEFMVTVHGFDLLDEERPSKH